MKRLGWFVLLSAAVLSACTRPPSTELPSSKPPAERPSMISQSTAISLALGSKTPSGEKVGSTYNVSRSELETVSPHGTRPRLVWKVLVQEKRRGFYNAVWVDAVNGRTEWVPMD